MYYLKIVKTIQVSVLAVLAIVLGIVLPVRTTFASNTPASDNVIITLDNIGVTTADVVNVEFGLTPGGIPVTQQVTLQSSKLINVSLNTTDIETADRWYLKVTDNQSQTLLTLAGQYPPVEGRGYSAVFSPASDKPLGKLTYPQNGSTFLFEANLDVVAPADTYTGTLWVDFSGDSKVQSQENTELQIAVIGNSLRAQAEIRTRSMTAQYNAVIKNGAEQEVVSVSGIWDFSAHRVVSSSFPVVPSLHGFAPYEGGGEYSLVNIIPKANDAFDQARRPGTQWVVISGPQTDNSSAGSSTEQLASHLRIVVIRNISSEPIAGAVVEVIKADQTMFSGKVDESGVVEVALTAGQYVVKVNAKDYLAEDTSVMVSAGQTQQITIHLKPTQPTTDERIRLFISKNWKFIVIGITGLLLAIGLGWWASGDRN
jgi:5-hydroxyisourate hydrolase-like protein (transthyretin family)